MFCVEAVGVGPAYLIAELGTLRDEAGEDFAMPSPDPVVRMGWIWLIVNVTSALAKTARKSGLT